MGLTSSVVVGRTLACLSAQVVVYNRTPSKAEVVASRFNGKAVGDLTDTKVGQAGVLDETVCLMRHEWPRWHAPFFGRESRPPPPLPPAVSDAPLFCLARQALMEATGGRPITVIVSTIPAAAGFTVRHTDWCQLLGVL